MRILTFLTCIVLFGCASLKKDNDPKKPNSLSEVVDLMHDVYIQDGRSSLDSHGMVLMDGSKGDSALFSCLAYSAGLASFDVEILFDNGKPLRHPDISPADSDTPISRDMVQGIAWCLYSLGEKDRAKALSLTKKMIEYGTSHLYLTGWNFCSDEDKEVYKIKADDFLGKCVMTPSTMKDIYRILILEGGDCDSRCQIAMAIGPNIPSNSHGFQRHLSIIATIRNGLVEGAINDNSLKLLREASKEEPNNALYSAAYHLFSGGDQSKTWSLLANKNLFPHDHAATSDNYCTGYLYQRDEKRKEDLDVVDGCVSYVSADTKKPVKECGLDQESVSRLVYNGDWLPCNDGRKKSMVDWLFAEHVAKGKLQ